MTTKNQQAQIGILYFNNPLSIGGHARQSVAGAEATFKMLPGVGVVVSPRSGAAAVLCPFTNIQGADLTGGDLAPDELPQPPGPPPPVVAVKRQAAPISDHERSARRAKADLEARAAAKAAASAPGLAPGTIAVNEHGQYYRVAAGPATDSTPAPASAAQEPAPEAQRPPAAQTAADAAPAPAAPGGSLPAGMIFRNGSYQRENPTPPVNVEGLADVREDGEAVETVRLGGRRAGPMPALGGR